MESNKGWFFEPTVLDDVPEAASVMHEEPFGPIAPISGFLTFDDAVARANSTPFGLAGYVFSQSLETARKASDALEVGTVGVNDMLFGGSRDSVRRRQGKRLWPRGWETRNF